MLFLVFLFMLFTFPTALVGLGFVVYRDWKVWSSRERKHHLM